MADAYLGSGTLYADRLTAAGASQGVFEIGNATKFALKANAEVKTANYKTREKYGQTLATVTINQPMDISITMNQIDKRNLAMVLLGEQAAATVVGASVTDEEITAPAPGKYAETAYRGISAVTVENATGHDASTWASETVYAEGAAVNPANDHWYKATTGGTSDTTEPTWPTDGSTVVDGTVTWTDMGLVVLVEDTDYDLTNARIGLIGILSGGSISEDDELYVSYTYASEDAVKIQAATSPQIKAKFILDGYNLVNGESNLVYAWEAEVAPTTEIDWLSDDFNAIELAGKLVTPTGKDAPVEIIQKS